MDIGGISRGAASVWAEPLDWMHPLGVGRIPAQRARPRAGQPLIQAGAIGVEAAIAVGKADGFVVPSQVDPDGQQVVQALRRVAGGDGAGECSLRRDPLRQARGRSSVAEVLRRQASGKRGDEGVPVDAAVDGRRGKRRLPLAAQANLHRVFRAEAHPDRDLGAIGRDGTAPALRHRQVVGQMIQPPGSRRAGRRSGHSGSDEWRGTGGAPPSFAGRSERESPRTAESIATSGARHG